MKHLTLICVLSFLIMSCETKNKPMVIGHRGAMGYETENTLASIQKAMDLGVDMIEIDVFNIKSGETVVFHDQDLERLSNAAGNIEEYYLSDLQKVILEGNHKIPMLQAVLKLINNQVKLNIELKGEGTANRVNHILKFYIEKRGWAKENLLISSFNWEELRKMRKLDPDIAIAVLTEEDPLKAIAVAKELKAVAINPWYKTLTKAHVKEIKEAGFKVNTYTVNEAADIKAVMAMGVDGIFSDYPDRVK